MSSQSLGSQNCIDAFMRFHLPCGSMKEQGLCGILVGINVCDLAIAFAIQDSLSHCTVFFICVCGQVDSRVADAFKIADA